MSEAPDNFASLGPAWNDFPVMIFAGQRDTHIHTGEDYGTASLGSLFITEPGDKPKEASPAFIPSSYHNYDGREHAAQREHGSFVALCGDVDKGDHTLQRIEALTRGFCGDAAWLIYSSAHSRPGDRRWRVILPLAAPLPFAGWHDAQHAFFAFMEFSGVAMDRALDRAGQPVYLPNVPAEHVKSGQALRSDRGEPLYFQRSTSGSNAPGLNPANGTVSAWLATLRRHREEDETERQRIRMEAEARRARQPASDGGNVMADFNQASSLANLLELYGYERSPRHGDDWRSPHQTGETYATRIIGDKWISLSGSDASARVGEQCKAGCFGDAYDLFVHYEHKGDHKAAHRALHAERKASATRTAGDYIPESGDEADYDHDGDLIRSDMGDYSDDDLMPAQAAARPVEISQVESDIEVRWPAPVNLWSRFEEPELPQGSLPLGIELFARRQAAIMGADPAGMAMAALSVCAAAIPDCIELQVKRNDPTWREHARLWVALVGPPSRKKTPVFKAAMAPLRAIDNQLMRAFLTASQEYDELPKDEKKTAQKPKQRRLIISDTTIEAAQEVMMDSPDGVLSEQDELSGWFGSMDRYNAKGGGDRAFWLKAFNGGTYNLNRIGRGAKQIPNLSISLLGGIQPEPMRKFAAESVDDGLLQRMLPVILRPSTVGQDVALDQTSQDYEHLISDLAGLRNGGHVLIHFSDGARVVRDRLEHEHLNLSMALESVSPKLSAHYGKYDGIFARLCLVWHCIECAYRELPREVSQDTAERVAKFMADFTRPSAIAFYAGVLGMSAGHEELVTLASIIVAKGMEEVSARDVQRAGQSLRHVTAEQFRLIAEKMEAFGWLERGEPPAKSNTPRWIVNPRVHGLFADRAAVEMSRRDAARDALRHSLNGDVL